MWLTNNITTSIRKNILYMMFIIFSLEIFEKKLHFLLICIHGISRVDLKVFEEYQYTSFKFLFYSLFFLYNAFFCSIYVLRYFVSFIYVFSNKRLNIFKQISFSSIVTPISSIVIGLIVTIFLEHLANIEELKQHIDVINTKYHSNAHQFSFRFNDIKIIWDVRMGCENENIDQGRSYVEKSINISFCFFSRYLEYSGHGGVIYVSASSYSMNINYSMFYNCACSNYGGGIHFISSNSCLKMLCAKGCSAFNRHFAYLIASQMNQVEYLSVSNCSHTTSGYESIGLSSGHQRVDNTNSSMNNAIQGSGTYLSNPSSFTSLHCTFSNNKVSDCICLLFSSTSGTISMSYANIVHNNSPTQYGVIYVTGAGSRKLMFCIFQNNQNYLFCIFEGSLEVSHSFIDHSGSFSTSTPFTTSNNNSFTNRITYQIQFFNSLHCNADIPLIEPKQKITYNPEYLKSISLFNAVTIFMVS